MMAPRWLRDWFQPRADHRAEPITAQEAARRLSAVHRNRERNTILIQANAMRARLGLPAFPLRAE